jgi:hypothetical protein
MRFERERGRIRGQEVEGVIDLKALFEHGLRFESSIDHAGLQLVDSAAYIVRRAVLRPDDDAVQAAYDVLRSKLCNLDGNSLTINRLRVGDEDRSHLNRYRPLYGPVRIA